MDLAPRGALNGTVTASSIASVDISLLGYNEGSA